MDGSAYTHARWVVRPGQEEAFVAAWQAVGEVFLRLPHPPPWGVLLRSEANPREFVSFGPWPDAGAVGEMRASPEAVAALDRARALCEEATPAAYRLVAAAGRPPDLG
ncbi:MAG TPA: hypothetical protein VM450_14200 [Thermomicrobiales bacterium]|nr:hypothetical protein [Thermomicrobiales bacterium]